MAKVKVFDEFLRELRLEAIRMTFLLSVFLVFGVQLFGAYSDFNGEDLIVIQVIIFLITYKIKKINATLAPHTQYE